MSWCWLIQLMILFRTSLILNWILQGGRGRGANRACDSGINLRRSCGRCVYAYIIGHRNMSICVIMEHCQLFCMYEYQPMQTLKQPSWTFLCPSQQRARHSSGRDWWDSSRGTEKSFTAPCCEPGQRSKIYRGTFTCGIPPPIIATSSIISIMQNRKEQVFKIQPVKKTENENLMKYYIHSLPCCVLLLQQWN